MQIKSLMMTLTRDEGYQDVYQRTYELSLSPADLQIMENAFDRSGVTSSGLLNPMTVSKLMPNVIGLKNQITGKADIVNGWNTKRIRFLLTIAEPIEIGVKEHYIQGYSEYFDPSFSGEIDDNARFHINSITTVTRMINPITGKSNVSMDTSYNVIPDLAGGVKYDGGVIDNKNDKLVRVNDIFETMLTLDTEMHDFTEVYNGVGDINSKTQTSTRVNNDPVKYFTKAVNSYVKAKNSAGMSHDPNDVIRAAAIDTAEDAVISNSFIYVLYKTTGRMNPTYFTLNELQKIDPTTPSRTHLLDNRSASILAQPHDPNVNFIDTMFTESTLQPTAENKIAVMIAQVIIATMTENLIGTLTVSFNNETGANVAIPGYTVSYIEGLDVTPELNRLLTYISDTLLPMISKNGLLKIKCNVFADLLEDTTIDLEVNLGGSIIYRFPTFADSINSSVITDDATRKGLTEDMSVVLDSTYGAFNALA